MKFESNTSGYRSTADHGNVVESPFKQGCCLKDSENAAGET